MQLCASSKVPIANVEQNRFDPLLKAVPGDLAFYVLTRKWTRSTVLLPPTLMLLACSTVTPAVELAEVKNFCRDD